MTQPPPTVTYSLDEVLGQILQKFDRIDEKFDRMDEKFDLMDEKSEDFRKEVNSKFETLQKEVNTKFETLQKEVNDKFDTIQQDVVHIKVELAKLQTEVQGVGKRLDTQEFINRSVVVGFVLALVAGAVKLFFPDFPEG
jgi:murein lipoprotein